METLNFIKSHATFAEGIKALNESFGIRVKEYPVQDTYILNYDQIESPKNHPITRECRSLVINSKAEVVSRSFDRFFNLGEGELEVDFSRALAQEKCDGSLIGLYFNPGANAWCWRTRGTGFAESELPSGKSYANAIMECIGIDRNFQNIFEGCDKTLTFIFEFVSPENRIVTRYPKPELVLLAVRENSGKYPHYMNGSRLDAVVELLKSDFGFQNVRIPKSLKISTVEEVEAAVDALQNLEEGFVVVDENFNRVKIKSPAYVKAHHIRGEGLTPKRVAELVAINEHEEYLAVFDEDLPFFEPFIEANKSLLTIMTDVFEEIKGIESQKDFALCATAFPFSAILFTARKRNCTIEHAWADAKETYKAELIIRKVGK